MLADYLQAAIPTPVTILGQRLHHFSLGLNMLLLRHESGFLRSKIAFGDLQLAVFICCQDDYDTAQRALEQPDLRELLKEWGKRCGKFDYAAKCREFAKYLRDGSAVPELLPVDESKLGRTPGAPFLQLIKITVMGELGYTRQEALNAPLGEVFNDYFAWLEKKGAAKIFGPDEQEHLDVGVDAVLEDIKNDSTWTVIVGKGARAV